MAGLMIDQLGEVGCKTALRLAQRAIVCATYGGGNEELAQTAALRDMLDDINGDAVTAIRQCEVS